MTDLLIRNIDPKLKRRLAAKARQEGTSLSDTAKQLLDRGLEGSRPGRPIGTALVELFAAVRPVELDIPPRELPRVPPVE